MLIFTSVNGRNCREKAGPSKCGRSELWDFNGDSSHDDIRDENENYDETVIDNENIDQTSREYFFYVGMPSISLSLSSLTYLQSK